MNYAALYTWFLSKELMLAVDLECALTFDPDVNGVALTINDEILAFYLEAQQRGVII